jgi:SagB-type dehydrogenase family enzyme
MPENNFSQLYHQYSKRIRNKIPHDSSEWPEEWKTVFYKTYPRLPKIKLLNNAGSYDLFEAIKNRRSRREFSDGKITLEELSLLLKYSAGITRRDENGDGRRAYPSGGARYPLETYCLISRASQDLKPCLYHYDVKNHQLVVLNDKNFTQEELAQLATYPFVKDAACMIFLTSCFWRSKNKYGERSYRFCLIEAGHIGQNIYLLSEALNLKCCSLGGMRISDETVERLLGIDGITESLVYAIVIGK